MFNDLHIFNNLMNKNILLILLCLFLIACENNRFTFFQNFEGNCWNIKDSLHFSQNIENPQSAAIAIQATYNEDYAFQNIYLRLRVKSPSGKDTSYIILDTLMDKMGKWRGGAGKKHELLMLDTLQLTLKEKGQYDIHITQYMRKDTLCGIESIGVNVL